MNLLGLSRSSQSAYGTISFGTLSGGVGAELSGGNFWQGAIVSGVVAGLNHSMHRMDSPLPNDAEGEDLPGKKNANRIEQAANVGKEIGTSAELIEAIDKGLNGNSKGFRKIRESWWIFICGRTNNI